MNAGVGNETTSPFSGNSELLLMVSLPKLLVASIEVTIDVPSGNKISGDPPTWKLCNGSVVAIPTLPCAYIDVNAKPVFVDIDESSFNINPSLIEDKITKKTKAILPVHLYGNPADMKRICRIAKENKLFVIEDAAQAHGAKIDDKFCGTFGDLACFSFFPGKNLGAFGDGGAIITNSKKISNFVLRMRNHGALNKYDHNGSGRKTSTLDDRSKSVNSENQSLHRK